MFYIVLFLILSSFVCIYSKEVWENFVDRLDLIFPRSYLIIQCNENEIQIIRYVNTFEELELNFECKNKDNILEHGIERVQMILFQEYKPVCETNKIFRIIAQFNRIKASLDKKENGVDWPYIDSPIKKEIKKIEPIKIKFQEQSQMNIRLGQFHVNELSEKKHDLFIYLDFLNRPMTCRILINGLYKKKHDGSCESVVLERVTQPLCYYKVDGQKTPSHEELNEIANKTYRYVKSRESNYTYLSNINNIIDSNNHSEEIDINNSVDSNNYIEEINPKEKSKKSQKISSKRENKKKSSSLMIIIIPILIICLIIIIIIGIILFYKKTSKEKEDQFLSSQSSDTSYKSNKSQKNSSPSLSDKQETTKRAATNWYELDEDI